MMLSANVDSMKTLLGRMRDINISSIPIDPFELISTNNWQISTYSVFSQVMHMHIETIMMKISPRAFSFYSISHATYLVCCHLTKSNITWLMK